MALTQEEREIFNAITSSDYVNIALVEAEYEGRRAAVIVSIEDYGDDILLMPLAKLVDKVDEERLTLDGQLLS